MDAQSFTVIDDGRIVHTTATFAGDTVRLSPATVHEALGWELKPQGLCKAERCIPVRARDELVNAGGIDLAALAKILGRPLAIDTGEGVACLGASAAERSAQLSSLQAPDFILPDINGQTHRLSDCRGKKVVLVAYASW
jgi:hypothetical protein